MPERFDNPDLTFHHKLGGGLKEGDWVMVKGVVKHKKDFKLELKEGEGDHANVGLEVHLKLHEHEITFNHRKDKHWKEVQTYKQELKEGDKFKLCVKVHKGHYEVSLREEKFTYPCFIKHGDVKHVRIEKGHHAVHVKRVELSVGPRIEFKFTDSD